MTKKEIKENLDDLIESEGCSILEAFDLLMENDVRELFKMNNWDVPKFKTLEVEYKKKKYTIDIEEDGCCEVTNEHRIMYWKHTIKELN